mgnify:CR=1 FL=1
MTTRLFTVLLGCGLVLTILPGCNQLGHERETGVTAPHGMVVTAHPEASEIGVAILKKGGSAVDAACAIELALAVSYPVAGNIGGGGFMVMRFNDGTVQSIDYREKAPAKATRDMYLDENSEVVSGLSTRTAMAVGVPGTIHGVITVHQRYGRLKFSEVIQPAIDLARNGFPVTENQAHRFNGSRERFIEMNGAGIPFIKDEAWQAGDILNQPDLARSLERIRDLGLAGFYEGETARLIIGELSGGEREIKGVMAMNDLQDYASVWRHPIEAGYKDFKIISMAPPSSGGIGLAQLLKMVEPFPIAEWGWQDPATMHVMIEAEKRVYADRAEYLGDPDFYPVPVDALLDDTYLERRFDDFSMEHATDTDLIGQGQGITGESEETTHYSVVDQEGNAVAGTTTLNGGFGCGILVTGAGFFLNNEMDDFSSKPGYPNIYGLVGGEANAIQPGKRMLSSMTPTIVEKGNDLFMVVGSPGGSTIITSVFQTILNVIEHEMTMQEAVRVPRFHHQWKPEVVFYEAGSLPDSLITILEEKGHKLQERGSIGRVDAILKRSDGTYEGGADPRGDDTARGY